MVLRYKNIRYEKPRILYKKKIQILFSKTMLREKF
jgi:hypothetical protein